MNYRWAGETHPSGVRFTAEGFPDFSPFAKARVELNGLTGNYVKDAALANKAVGLKATPKDMVWHHVEDAGTMMLIPKDIHNAVRHTGGAAVIRGQQP